MSLKTWLKNYFDDQNDSDINQNTEIDNGQINADEGNDGYTDNQMQANQPKKSLLTSAKEMAQSVWGSATSKTKEFLSVEQQKAKEQLEKARRIKRIVFIVWNIVSIFFYTLISLITIIKNWSESKLSYVIIGVTVIYVLVFLVILLVSAKSDKLKQNITKYKSGMRLWRILLNLLSTSIALLIVINTLSADGFATELSQSIANVLSIGWLVIKILIGVFKLLKFARKQKKLANKQRKLAEK